MNSKFRTLELSINLHRECQNLKMKAYLKSQLERATSSVALMLASVNSAKLSDLYLTRFGFQVP